jgi:hypothetical protein
MSYVTVPEFALGSPPNTVSATPTLSGNASADINGAGQYVAYVFMMPSTETINRLWFRVHSVTTGCTALARIETLDAATGLPTGTLANANASVSIVIGNSAGDYEATFPGTFALTKGTDYVLIVAQSSGTPSAVHIGQFSDDNSGAGLPYVIDFDATATSRTNVALLMGLGKSDGGAVSLRHLWPINATGTETYQATSTPDTIGNRIVLAAPMRCCGAWCWIDADSTGTIKLFGTDGATVLASAAIETNVPPSVSAFLAYYHFSTSVELAAGTYWLAAEATGGANIGLAYCDFPTAGWRDGSPMGGGSMTYATCTQTPTSTASWTVTDTRQAFIGLLFDGISDGAGGGGGETSHTFAA